jgi:predicted DNA-binding transcriptional regulator
MADDPVQQCPAQQLTGDRQLLDQFLTSFEGLARESSPRLNQRRALRSRQIRPPLQLSPKRVILRQLMPSGILRRKVAKRYNFSYAETDTSIRKGLEKFQNAVVQDCRALYVCREIANGSKHMGRKKASKG